MISKKIVLHFFTSAAESNQLCFRDILSRKSSDLMLRPRLGLAKQECLDKYNQGLFVFDIHNSHDLNTFRRSGYHRPQSRGPLLL